MFFRRMGNKVLLLHSWRDGEGKVQQTRLGQFDTLRQLSAVLDGDGWDAWRRDVQAAFPQFRANWDTLLRKARQLAVLSADDAPARKRTSAVRAETDDVAWRRTAELIRALTRCLSDLVSADSRRRLVAELEDLRDVCVGRPTATVHEARELVRQGRLEAARDVLERCVRQAERETRGTRKCFAPGDPTGKDRLQALELLAEVLQRLNQRESAALQWRERVRTSPDPDAIANYGACLHQLGRLEEAARQYRRLPNRDSRRHFHLAAFYWQSGKAEHAIHELLQGLVHDRSVGEHLATLQKGRPPQGYWARHSSLWSSSGRQFFAAVFKEPAVRWSLSRAAERRRKPRQLLPARTVGLLLEKALLASVG